MNNITISGNLGRDARTNYTTSGKFVTNFSVAVNDGKKDGQKQTLWVAVVGWGEYFEKVSEYLKKGTYVIVSGRASVEPTREGNNGQTYGGGLMVTANQIELGPNGGRRESSDEEPEETTEEEPAKTEIADDDIPF